MGFARSRDEFSSGHQGGKETSDALVGKYRFSITGSAGAGDSGDAGIVLSIPCRYKRQLGVTNCPSSSASADSGEPG